MAAVAACRPPVLKQEFKEKAAMVAWANKCETALIDTQSCPAGRGASLDWFRGVVNCENAEYHANLSMEQIIIDLKELGGGYTAPVPLGNSEFPPDVISSLFPGGDHPTMPVDTLVTVPGAQTADVIPTTVVPGAMVICKPGTASFDGMPLPFTMGMCLAPDTGSPIFVAWWVPSRSRKVDFKKGRKALIADIFAPWRPLDTLTADEGSLASLPDVEVPQSDILLTHVELENDKVPHKAFDRLRFEHHIDVTALSLSQTQGGNTYRVYAQVACD